jgi:hypothetical protein
MNSGVKHDEFLQTEHTGFWQVWYPAIICEPCNLFVFNVRGPSSRELNEILTMFFMPRVTSSVTTFGDQASILKSIFLTLKARLPRMILLLAMEDQVSR